MQSDLVAAARKAAADGTCHGTGTCACEKRTGHDRNGQQKLWCGPCFGKVPECATPGCEQKAFGSLSTCIGCDVMANPDLYTMVPYYQKGASRPTPPDVVAFANAAANATVEAARERVAETGCICCGRRTGKDAHGRSKLYCSPCWSAQPDCSHCCRNKAYGKSKLCLTCMHL